MTSLVNLNVKRWLDLCDYAEAAANSRLGPEKVAELATAASRLTTIHALPFNMSDTAMTTSFRWDCQAFGLASPLSRTLLAPGLLAKAAIIRDLLSPAAPKGEAALPVPVPPVEPPSWTQRRDIGG